MLSREPQPPRAPPQSRRWLFILAALGVVLLFAPRALAVLWTDYLWYQSVGLTSVWSTLFFTRVALVAGASVVAFGVLWLNLVVTDRLSPRVRLLDMSGDDEVVERFQEWIEPRIARVRLIVAAVLGVMIGAGAGAWRDGVLLYLNEVNWGTDDPVFGLDISFFVIRLPLFRDVASWLFQLLVIATLLVAALHYLNGGIRLRRGRGPEVTGAVKVHLSVLLAVLALLKAVMYRLDAWELVYSTRGTVWGASYTDVNAQLPALNLLAFISLAGAVLLLMNIRRRGWLLPGVALGGWLVVSIVVGGIYPAVIQRFQVDPTEFQREEEYIGYNIEFTREAFGFGDVEVRSFPASQDLDVDAIEANRPTIDNLRLWDPVVLRTTYRQLQELRTYYKFDDVDTDRYPTSNGLTQVMLAARELDYGPTSPNATWVNQYLVFTHGFGAVLSPTNSVSPEGQPAFLVKDIPPATEEEALRIDQPRIYFGEGVSSTSFVFVRTREKEVDFPLEAGTDAVQFNTYDGAGGVEMGSLVRRAAFALRFGDFNTLISNQLTGDTKVLMARNVADRVGRAAPFLYADADPYMVVLDGRLVWVVDMYTVSDGYPYSQPANTARLGPGATLPTSFNYIRNSVKAAVDAYDGTMTFYVVDPTDPLLGAYRKMFPRLFTDGTTMPEELRAHLRYPEDLFRVQGDMYTRYHVTDSRVLYNNSDPWAIARDPSTTEEENIRLEAFYRDSDGREYKPMLPYYLLMRLPDEEQLAFLIMQPFTPANRPNMVSFMVAKSGPEEYGRLIDFQLPRDRLVDGPGQIGARVNQDPEISAQFTLLGQQGSDVIQGNMLVVPVDTSVMYVQPIYLRGTQAALPEFKRVVVVFQERVVMRESLEDALGEVFGGVVVERPPPPDVPVVSGDVAELLQQAEEAFAEAEQALRAGDLGRYQDKVEEGRELIQQALDLLAQEA